MWDNTHIPDSKQMSRQLILDSKLGLFYKPDYDNQYMLYWYDGPVTFIQKVDDKPTLFTKIKECKNWQYEDYWELWILLPMSEQEVEDIINNTKPFIQFWLNKPNVLLEVTYTKTDGTVHAQTRRAWKDIDIPKHWLPEENTKLFMTK